jgi:hypothetical protein
LAIVSAGEPTPICVPLADNVPKPVDADTLFE